MARQRIRKTEAKYRKSKSHPKNCPTCGKFWGKKKK